MIARERSKILLCERNAEAIPNQKKINRKEGIKKTKKFHTFAKYVS